MDSLKYEAANSFSYITIFIGSTASVALHVTENIVKSSDGFPWTIGPTTWQAIVLFLLPFFILTLAVIVSRRNFSRILGLATSILCTALVFGQFAMHDPQHGADDFFIIWLIEVTLCIACFCINSAVAFVTLVFDHIKTC